MRILYYGKQHKMPQNAKQVCKLLSQHQPSLTIPQLSNMEASAMERKLELDCSLSDGVPTIIVETSKLHVAAQCAAQLEAVACNGSVAAMPDKELPSL